MKKLPEKVLDAVFEVLWGNPLTECLLLKSEDTQLEYLEHELHVRIEKVLDAHEMGR